MLFDDFYFISQYQHDDCKQQFLESYILDAYQNLYTQFCLDLIDLFNIPN